MSRFIPTEWSDLQNSTTYVLVNTKKPLQNVFQKQRKIWEIKNILYFIVGYTQFLIHYYATWTISSIYFLSPSIEGIS